jgi:sterol desaturase/sphingolipid hydroxylase (fatty acid hydroxylase superfamily)
VGAGDFAAAAVARGIGRLGPAEPGAGVSDRTFLIALLAILGLFVVLDAIELRRSTWNGRAARPSGEAFGFLLLMLALYGVIQLGGLALVPSTERMAADVRSALGAWFGRPAAEPIRGVWLVLLSVVLFYVSGLWDYLLHRFLSHSRRFFFTHEYHHLPSQVNVIMPGLAMRPFVVITAFPATVATVLSAYTILLLLGLPLWDLAPLKILVLIQGALLAASHSCFLRRWWWVHHGMKCLALTTPQEHLLHHTVDLEGNYGNFTVLWDRVFGTYLDPTRSEHQNHALGLAYDQDFLGALTAGHVKLPASIRQRFEVGRFCNLEPERPGSDVKDRESGARTLDTR